MVALLKPTKKWRFSSLLGAGHSPHWAEFSPREGGRWIPRGLLRILGTHEGGSLKSHHTHIHFLILIQLMMFYSPMSSSSSHSAAQLGCYASSGGGIFPQAVAQTGYFGIIGFLLGIHYFQVFALKIPSKVSWGDAGLPPSPWLIRVCFLLEIMIPWRAQRSDHLMVDAGKPWRWQELPDKRALTILCSQKLERRHSEIWK